MYAGSPRSPGVYLAVILFTSWTTTRDFFTYVSGAWRPEGGMDARIHDHFRLAAGKNMKATPQKLYEKMRRKGHKTCCHCRDGTGYDQQRHQKTPWRPKCVSPIYKTVFIPWSELQPSRSRKSELTHEEGGLGRG